MVSPWRDARVVFEDDALLVVDKPHGVPTVKSDGALTPRLEARQEAHGESGRLRIMHQLDGEASGLVVFAKQSDASRAVAAQLERGVSRSWVAGVTGQVRDGEVVARRGDRSLVRITRDGRAQPIRRMLAASGTPIAGDVDNRGAPALRLMLHAERIQLTHPSSSAELALEAKIPAALRRWLEGRDAELPKNAAELDERLGEAVERRDALAPHGDAYRLVNDGGDALWGVDVDRYGDFAVVALRGDEAVAAREAVLDAVARLGFAGVYLKLRPKQANVIVDTRRDDYAPEFPARGAAAPDVMMVHEHGVAYEVRLGDGLSTGIFLDQRNGRALVRKLAPGRRVLNLFAYHAAFSVAAIAGGASATVSVDASGVAVERARSNIAQLGGDGDAHRVVRADVITFLERDKGSYDVIILDPPSFATTKRTTFRVARDYPRLATLALKRLASGGHLLACTNHRGMTSAKLERHLRDAATLAGATVARMTRVAEPLDHPPPAGEPCHLKSVLVELA
jgi:23S rRNA (cytosine1962-C5)-methyltransferase